MENKFKIGGLVAFLLVCLISVITSMISLNCLADKKEQCAQVSGIMAVVMGCAGASILAMSFMTKRRGGA